MPHQLFKFTLLIIVFSFASCTNEKNTQNDLPEKDIKSTTPEQTSPNLVCFNHSLLVLDSTTYDAVINSEFINHFAYSHEKQLTGWHGFYLVGKTNYLEMFHPNSFDGEVLEKGTVSIYLASLKANYLKRLGIDNQGFMEFTSQEDYNYLTAKVSDSNSQLKTWEMRKIQFESWTKKEYHDSVTFLPVDYNSPQESDSSDNYLMNDVNGMGLSLNPDDSLTIINYLNEIGYDSVSEFKGHTRFSNDNQFIELHVSKTNKFLSINRYYIQLNKSVEKSTEIIGNSRIECDGKSAIWIFE